MVGKKRLVFDRENGVDVFACGACAWVRPYLGLGGKHPDAELKDAFDQHECAQNPRERMPREDVNQADAGS